MSSTKAEEPIFERFHTEIKLLQQEGNADIEIAFSLMQVAIGYAMSVAPTPMAGVYMMSSLANSAIKHEVSRETSKLNLNSGE